MHHQPPASTEAQRLVDALESAAEHLWAGDCYERTVLARRVHQKIEITDYSPREHPAEALLELVAEGAPVSAWARPERVPGHPAGLTTGRIVLTVTDVADLAAGHSINVSAGPRGQEMNLFGEDFEADAIAALQAGGSCEVDGFTFTAEQRTPPEFVDINGA